MYGHQFYLASLSERVEYLNNELKKRKYDSLEVLAEDIFIDIEDLKEELKKGGYFYVPDLNRFVQIEMGQAGSEPSHFLLLRKTCLFYNFFG
ncbi:hypothetical protein D478_03619 [Brevibacillus agri BAB-2500]|nr:hypothetical protein D478_03619 [Brevibacillus agri BAB-2500]